MRSLRGQRGFGLVEVLISGTLVVLAAMAAVAYITRSAQHADWSRDKVFARQKALSILAELRAYVEGGKGEVAADLDGFDDGLGQNASLTISPDPNDGIGKWSEAEPGGRCIRADRNCYMTPPDDYFWCPLCESIQPADGFHNCKEDRR